MALPFCSLPDLSSTDFPQREHPQSVYYDMAPAQRMFEQYGPDSMSVSTWQAQSFGRPAVTMQPFGPPTLYSSQKQFHDGFSVNKPPMAIPIAPKTPMMPMVPQKPPRKRKAATLRAAAWEPYRKRILELHIEQNRSVHEVKQIMEDEHGFKAEVRQYRSRISRWGHDKNVKRHEMQAIVRKHQKRKLVETDKRPLVFEVRGNEVDRQKIERWMRSYDVSGSFLYRPEPAAPTPPTVGCRTISERGSPAPTTITVYSNPAQVMSLDDADFAVQKPQVLSPALSLSGSMRYQTNVHAEQAPVLMRHSHPRLQLSFIYNHGNSTSVEDNSVQIVYGKDEEMRLRGNLVMADLTVMSDVPEILLMMLDFGRLLLKQGRYSAAEEVGWRLIDGLRCQICDGRDSMRILCASFLLGEALSRQRAFAKAEVVLRRALQSTDLIEHNYGDKAKLLYNLGLLLKRQRKVTEAEAMFRQSLTLRETHVGRVHPKTINSATRLGMLLQNRGRLDEAEAILNKTFVLSGKLLEVADYIVKLNMSSLLKVLAGRIEHEKAEEMYRRMLTIKEKLFGPAHLKTISSREDLAVLLYKQHRCTEAEEVYREVLVLRKQVLGSDHPKTLSSMSKLGMVLYEQNRYKETEVMLRELLAKRKKVLGFEHPTTMSSMKNLGRVLCMQDRHEEAEAMFTEALALSKKVLGSEHPDTLASMKSLQRVLERRCIPEEALSVPHLL